VPGIDCDAADPADNTHHGLVDRPFKRGDPNRACGREAQTKAKTIYRAIRRCGGRRVGAHSSVAVIARDRRDSRLLTPETSGPLWPDYRWQRHAQGCPQHLSEHTRIVALQQRYVA